MIKKPTKAHIVCDLLLTHGPMPKAALLLHTAQIEGKPYKPRSNTSYFEPGPSPWCKQSFVANGLIKVVGKMGNTLVYGLDTKGFAKAAEYRNWLCQK